MAVNQLSATDKDHPHHYPSPDTHPVSTPAQAQARTTPAPPSPPLSSTSSPGVSLLSSSVLRRRASASASASLSLPPSVLKPFRAIQAHQGSGYSGPSWVKYPNVSPDDLDALLSAAESIQEYKLRYDYDPIQEFLVLRMHEGAPHVAVKNQVQQSIWELLRARLDLAIEAGQHVKALRSIKTAVRPLVEAGITLPDGSEKRPDVSFFYQAQASGRGCKYPPLVVEVAHSQKSEELPALARTYIEHTDGDIHTVITIDLGYRNRAKRAVHRRLQRGGQEAGPQRRVTRSASHGPLQATLPSSLSIFRLGDIALQDQPFRTKQGPVDGGFELNVADFVPLSVTNIPRDFINALSFNIPFGDLCTAVAYGEELQALEERTPTPQTEAMPNRKRVHFTWSLPEAEAATKTEGDSSDSEPSSSKRRKMAVEESSYRGRVGLSAPTGSRTGVVVRTRSKTRRDTSAGDADGDTVTITSRNRTRSQMRSER